MKNIIFKKSLTSILKSDIIFDHIILAMNRTFGTGLMKGNSPTTIDLIDNATRTKLQQSFRVLWEICNIRKLRL